MEKYSLESVEEIVRAHNDEVNIIENIDFVQNR